MGFGLLQISIISILVILVIVLAALNLHIGITNKVLREGKEDVEQELKEKKESLAFLAKNLPVELYQQARKEKGGRVSYEPAFLPFAVMDVNTVGFNEQIHSMQAKDIFEFINGMLIKTVPYIYSRQGIIDRFHRAGFTALFDDSCEEALEAAVSISEIIQRETERERDFQSFSVGLSYGTVMTGLAGTENRMSLITVSEYTGISSFLQAIARKYNACILVTGTFCSRISSFEHKFHARKIGYIYITATKSLEEIYDVFDGDPIEVRNNKRKTKIVFEKAVELYGKGEYEKARQHFIEVFKTNKHDLAAKEYLKRCEINLAKQQDGNGKYELKPQIETY